MRLIDEEALNDITFGSTVFGSGGGGDPYIGTLLARDAIRRFGPVPLVDVEEVPDDANVVFIAGMGAPGVLVEKLPRAEEYDRVLRLFEERMGVKYDYVCPAEAGGLNAVTPFATAAVARIPVIDADGMGRAFPHLEMVTPTLYGGKGTPMMMVDEHGNDLFMVCKENSWAEVIARSAAVASGANTAMALYPMTGAQAKAWLVRGVLSASVKLGQAIRQARAEHRSAVRAVIDTQNGILLFEGKIEHIERRNEGGWTFGQSTISGVGADEGRAMILHSQNEHLIAERDGEIVATTPDLIMTLELDSGEPIPAEEIRYGFRVAVIGLPCDDRWRTPDGLKLAGPRRFNYDTDFTPVEEFAR
ncbi:MAG: DUF917 domain-containing protein [Microbacterium sp.]|uniref:DUF917 domain-containing protein n=1 Tax=Microbacterium sp. TaxID=51671 RepID=UPI0039E7213E